MKLFDRLSFPFKLALIGGLPLAFVIALIIQLNIEKENKRMIVEGFVGQLRQSTAINSVINALQIERRNAFRYVSTGKSQTEYVLAKQNTDATLQSVEQSGYDKAADFSNYTGFNYLRELRNKIENRNLQPSEVIDAYTNIIIRLNNIAPLSTGKIPYLKDLSKDIKSQRLISQIVTYLGLIRASIYNQAILNNDDPEINAISSYYQYYISLEKEFLLKASSSTIDAYIQLKRNNSMREMLDYIDLVVKSRAIPRVSNIDDWWDNSAVAVDDLRQLQLRISTDIVARAAQINSEVISSRNRTNLAIAALVVLVISIIWMTIKSLTETMQRIKTVTGNLALGITGNKLDIPSGDVMGTLADSILYIDSSNVDLANAANEIGSGNFTIEIQPRSAEDVLGNAILKMKENLERYNKENVTKIWMQEGLAMISESVRGEKSIPDLTHAALSAVLSHLKAETGVFYLTDNNGMHFVTGVAVHDESVIRRSIENSENLAGEVLRSGRIKVIRHLPPSYFKIASLTGETVPRNVVIIPLIQNDFAEGVIELGTLHNVIDEDVEFARQAANIIATAIHVTKNRVRMQELLEQTQAQAEELQAQHGELENLNAELEAQTEKLQASEEELRVQQEELEQNNMELQERSAQLEEKNVEITRKSRELEQSTRYKSEFLANVSHELRTPLNSILLLSRLLYENNDKRLNEEEVEYARVIQASGSGLLNLIDEILDLSKIEAGKMTVEPIDLPFEILVHEMETMFKPQASDRGLYFKVVLDEKLSASVRTDKMKCEQILRNLLSNAIKFTSHGGVTLTIEPALPHHVNFKVTDTGIGIPKEKQDVIFEAFQQADGSTKRKYGGTGLGLSISRQLARLLGGNIRLESLPGKGSTFILTLPIEHHNGEPPQDEKQPEEAAPVHKFVSEQIPTAPADDRHGIKAGDKVMLIVEDDVNFATALIRCSHDNGYKVVTTVRGDEALPLALKYQPTGVLLDLELPIKSGLQVIDELKHDQRTRHIPVHIMSSHSARHESLSKGAIEFTDKPVTPESLKQIFSKIEDALHRKPGKVLIVEDNQQHAKALSYYLDSFDISSEVMTDINDASNAMKQKDVDCVILDMSIPGAKGYEALEAIHKKGMDEPFPIIVFTGKSLSEAEQKRIDQFATTVVVKTAASYQRMLDEVTLFLHMVDGGNRKNTRTLGSMKQVLEGKKVLIADDDVRNIFSLTRALENYKMTVVTAENGKEALEILEKEPDINVVLLDMMMPEMDGYETASRIRKNRAWKDLPVIAVTAKAMIGDREKCIQAGASDYITKPVDLDQLLSLLRVWLYDLK